MDIAKTWSLGHYNKASVIWSRIRHTTLPLMQLNRSLICEKDISTGRVKVLTLIEESNEFPSVIQSWWVNFQSGLCRKFLLQTLNLGISWHPPYREMFRLGERKCLQEEKLSRLPGLHNLPTQVVSPPRGVRNRHINCWLNFAKKSMKR